MCLYQLHLSRIEEIYSQAAIFLEIPLQPNSSKPYTINMSTNRIRGKLVQAEPVVIHICPKTLERLKKMAKSHSSTISVEILVAVQARLRHFGV